MENSGHVVKQSLFDEVLLAVNMFQGSVNMTEVVILRSLTSVNCNQ